MSEVETLLRELDLEQKKSALAITFKDKAPAHIEKLAEVCRERLGLPVVVVNKRELDAGGRGRVLTAMRGQQLFVQAGSLLHLQTDPETTRVEW